MHNHAREVKSGGRFTFGKNWSRFLENIDEQKIEMAKESLQQMLGKESLEGIKFLDAGSGSGLFSLAARMLGANVHSFDYDPDSVACTAELKARYYPDDEAWKIEEASILDKKYISTLGLFDVVYSWGVLHHTGAMWDALDNVTSMVATDGQLFIAIYNDQGFISKYWQLVKRIYNKNIIAKYILVIIHAPYLIGMRWLLRAITGRLSLERGMTLWYDMIDWLGGYPFEVAKPEDVFHFFNDKGFVLKELKTCGGRMGCNEFVFQRHP